MIRAFSYLAVVVSSSALFEALDKPWKLAEILKNVRNVDVVEAEYQMTPLMWAAQNGHAHSAVLLIAAGASVHQGDMDNYTALVHAAINNHLEIVQNLVAAGSSISHATSDTGNNALMWACAYGHADIADFLLENIEGVNLDQRGSGGGTALHLAARHGHMGRIVQKLIQRGADYRLQDLDGNEPLMTATHHNNAQVVSDILEIRGNSQRGVYPSDVIGAKSIAQQKRLTAIVKLLDKWLGDNELTVSVVLP
jgi:serine/threonine-protein phosphatase 6 regulatory ankyrin repeat subunit B